MPYFARKPAVVEAIQFTGDNFYECAYFLGRGDLTHINELDKHCKPSIPGACGSDTADVNDWIVRNTDGSFRRMNQRCFDLEYSKTPIQPVAVSSSEPTLVEQPSS